MFASKRIAKSCLLGLCIFQTHALAAPDSGTAPFRLENDASRAIRFKLDPIRDEYFPKPIRLIPIEDSLNLRPEADLAAAETPPLAPKTAPRFPIPLLPPPPDLADPSLSLGYPFVLSKAESIGAEGPVEGAKAVEKAVLGPSPRYSIPPVCGNPYWTFAACMRK